MGVATGINKGTLLAIILAAVRYSGDVPLLLRAGDKYRGTLLLIGTGPDITSGVLPGKFDWGTAMIMAKSGVPVTV